MCLSNEIGKFIPPFEDDGNIFDSNPSYDDMTGPGDMRHFTQHTPAYESTLHFGSRKEGGRFVQIDKVSEEMLAGRDPYDQEDDDEDEGDLPR